MTQGYSEPVQVEHVVTWHCQFCAAIVEARAAAGGTRVPPVHCPMWVVKLEPPTEANVTYQLLACEACALAVGGGRFAEYAKRHLAELAELRRREVHP